MDLCSRCYIRQHPELKKKDIKQLKYTTEKYECECCHQYKALVVMPRRREAWEDEEAAWQEHARKNS